MCDLYTTKFLLCATFTETSLVTTNQGLEL